MYTARTPGVVKALYSNLCWNFSRDVPDVFITFDDGPHPEITGEVLTHLDAYNAKATFFCVGANAQKFPSTLQQTLDSGHSLGNHTWNHMNGWKNPDRAYFRNVLQCEPLFKTQLFRPPYGRITRSQAKILGKRFRIIMWDVLCGDFDKSTSYERCLQNVIRHVQPGSVVIFHDSEKAAERMLYTLPRALDYIASKNWNCKAIPMF